MTITSNSFKIIPPFVRPSPFIIAEHNLLSTNVPETEYAAYNPATVYNSGDRVIISSTTSTVTLASGTPGVFTWATHSLPSNTAIRFTATVLPTELSEDKVYYTVEETTNTFSVSTIPGGSALPIVTSGTTITAQATRHDVYEATATTTAGDHPAVVVAKWVRVSASNTWRMFDTSSSSVTTNADSIDFTIRTVGRINAVTLLGVKGETIRIIVTDLVDGIIYDQEVSGLNTSGIDSPSLWFFEPVDFKEEIDFSEIPPLYSNLDIQIIITSTGNIVECGICVVGLLYSPGDTQRGVSLGIEDYTLKTTDSFGNITVVERGFSKEINLEVLVSNIGLDRLQKTLSKLRATPTVYIGLSPYGSTIALGYYERFSTLVKYPSYSVLSVQLRGIA